MARVLPEWTKAKVRGRLFGFRPAGVSLAPVFTADDRGPMVTLGAGVTFRYSQADRPDLDYHLTANGASIEEMAGFLDLARGAQLLFDVGAAKGLFAVVFCALADGTSVVAFEPSPAMASAANAWARLNGFGGRIDVRGSAVGASPGRLAMPLHADGLVSAAPGGNARALDVDVTTIDAEAARLGRDPDVIKIDVEGFEDEVVQGAQEVLARRRPDLSFELHLDILERRGIAPSRITGALRSHGYRFYTSTGRRLREADVADSLHAVLRFIARA